MRTQRIPMAALIAASVLHAGRNTIQPKRDEPQFQTSDRCLACHNGLVTASGGDVSIGFHWRASMMANSSRDPYWQGSVRREVIDHPESQAHIEDECSVCHMPITRYEAKLRGNEGEIFSHLPISTDDTEQRQAADGVSCSVCHQITREKFGTRNSFNGGFVVHGPGADGNRTEYGPFEIEQGRITIMRSSTEGYRPEEGKHIRESELCATCHTLITTALGAGGRVIGALPEQMPYPEWLHSDYRNKQSCQDCHMPKIDGPVQIARVLGEAREGARLHSFVGSNFFMLNLLNRYREELNVSALPPELIANAQATVEFLQAEAATVAMEKVVVESGRLRADVVIRNKNGHKLPTAYPSRRVWLHFVVRDRNDRTTVAALLAAGFTQAADVQCLSEQIDAHAVWRSTRSGLALSPYQRIDPAGSGDGVQVTAPLMDLCRSRLGARCVLENNSLRNPPQGGDYTPMYALIQRLGAPISFQTAAPAKLGGLETVIGIAAGMGASAVELPQGYGGLTPGTLAALGTQLVAPAAQG